MKQTNVKTGFTKSGRKYTITYPQCPYIKCEFFSVKMGQEGTEEIHKHMETCRSYENHTKK